MFWSFFTENYKQVEIKICEKLYFTRKENFSNNYYNIFYTLLCRLKGHLIIYHLYESNNSRDFKSRNHTIHIQKQQFKTRITVFV